MRAPLLPLAVLIGLASLATAGAQGREAFADPDATPIPPVVPVVVPGPAEMPGAAFAGEPFVITLSLAITPAQFASLVARADPADLLRALTAPGASPAILASLLAATDTATRQRVADALTGATPAQAVALFSGLATTGKLAASMAGVAPGTLVQLLTVLAHNPAAVRSLLSAVVANGDLAKVAVAMEDRMFSLRIAPDSAVDLEVLTAISEFAAQDIRFRDIGNYSFFGRRLEQVRQRVKTEGLTAENKAEIVSIYRQATEALKAFQEAEVKPGP